MLLLHSGSVTTCSLWSWASLWDVLRVSCDWAFVRQSLGQPPPVGNTSAPWGAAWSNRTHSLPLISDAKQTDDARRQTGMGVQGAAKFSALSLPCRSEACLGSIFVMESSVVTAIPVALRGRPIPTPDCEGRPQPGDLFRPHGAALVVRCGYRAVLGRAPRADCFRNSEMTAALRKDVFS
jgi:hypothetical protein